MIKPEINGCKVIYQPPNSSFVEEIEIQIGKKSTDLFASQTGLRKEIPSSVKALTKWGETWHFLSKADGVNKVEEHGPLDWGLRLSQAINKFYDAISYIPPHGFNSAQKITLRDSIRLATDLLDLLNEAQLECKERFPTINSLK